MWGILADALSRFLPEQRSTLHLSFALADPKRLQRLLASAGFRAIINALADVSRLENLRAQEDILSEMQIVLARYGARVTLADLGEPLLVAVDELVAAQSDNELRSRLDRLRVLRTNMLKHEREKKV